MLNKFVLGSVLIISLFGIAGFFLFFTSLLHTHLQTAQVTSASGLLPTSSASVTPDVSRDNQTFILPIAQPNYLPIRDFGVADIAINARSAGLYDIKSTKFLYMQDIDHHLPIASITKLMTAVVVEEKLNLDDIITINAEDINVSGLGADLTKGEQITAKNLLKIMLIKSSNDAASSFASQANKQGINLIDLMNQKAKELAMDNTQFKDPAGLDDTAYSTVRDLVTLVSYISKNHQDIWEILRKKSDDIPALNNGTLHHVINTDQLLGLIPRIIGGKTGYTDAALGTMALTVYLSNNNDSLISIVLGTKDRFGETKRLIDWAKSAYRWKF